jgi:hypothetical protein
MQSGHQLEYDVILHSELDSNPTILNWIGSPPSRARLLGSPAPSWCSVYPPWSSTWFRRTIKSVGSNRLSILQVEEHKNEFTWWFNCCARDRVIGPSISTEEMIVAEVLMSSSFCINKNVMLCIDMPWWTILSMDVMKYCGYFSCFKFLVVLLIHISVKKFSIQANLRRQGLDYRRLTCVVYDGPTLAVVG